MLYVHCIHDPIQQAPSALEKAASWSIDRVFSPARYGKHPLLWVCFGEPSWRSYKHILCPPQSSTHLSPPHISLSLISQSCPFQVPDHFNKPVAISLKPKSVFSSVRLSLQTKILLDILPTRRTFCPHCPSEPCLLGRNATVPLAGWCLHIMENHL